MNNFIVQHRKNDDVIYDSIDEAKEVIEGMNGVDGEIVIARYHDNDSIKSMLGVCSNVDSGNQSKWTVFSYDDLLLERVIPKDGEDGQILTKTEDGAQWKNNVNFWKGTLTEYVAIKDKDPDCIYFIVDNNINITSD